MQYLFRSSFLAYKNTLCVAADFFSVQHRLLKIIPRKANLLLYLVPIQVKKGCIWQLKDDNTKEAEITLFLPLIIYFRAPFENRFPINSSIAEIVAATGDKKVLSESERIFIGNSYKNQHTLL